MRGKDGIEQMLLNLNLNGLPQELADALKRHLIENPDELLFIEKLDKHDQEVFDKVFPIFLRFADVERINFGTQTSMEVFTNFIIGDPLPERETMDHINEVLRSNSELLEAYVGLELEFHNGEVATITWETQSGNKPYPEFLLSYFTEIEWGKFLEAEGDLDQLDEMTQSEVLESHHHSYIKGEEVPDSIKNHIEKVLASDTSLLKNHLELMVKAGQKEQAQAAWERLANNTELPSFLQNSNTN